MLTALIISVLAAEPPARLFMAGGGTTEAQAKKLKASLKLPTELRLSAAPKVVDSATISGLKPGFFVVVLGACRDSTAAESRYNDGLAALIQRQVKGAYAKAVTRATASDECPLWLPGSSAAAKKALKTPLDAAALFEVAKELDEEADVVAATIVGRRVLSLNADLPGAADLLRRDELLSEDLPDRLP